MTTSPRDQMLASIRAGLQSSRTALEAEADRAPHAPPPFVHPPHDDLIEQFAAELAKLEGTPHRCADDEAALDVIEDLLQQYDATATVAWDLAQLELPGIDALLAKHGIAMLDGTVFGADRAAQLQTLEPAQVGVSGAFAGIAESGTLVLLGGPGRGRLASLLPPTHIAVLRRAQLVRGLGEALARLQAQHGANVLTAHSSITLVTGPSRTADIEMTLALGIHGPRNIHVVLIE